MSDQGDAKGNVKGTNDPAHKNDMYGNIDARTEEDAGVQAPIPSATVVLLRDNAEGEAEILMLKKNSKITFGGMWVFPGGKIDAEDATDVVDDDSGEQTARVAAARETREEAGLVVQPDDFVWFAHWTPPPGPQKRFATWFFVASVKDSQEITIDDGEIKDHDWVSPAEMLKRHAAGDVDLVPPTWVTLHHLSLRTPTEQIVAHLHAQPAKIYSTRVVKAADGTRVAMWRGDAGYEDWDADLTGARHRLNMASDGFVFENTVEAY